jgi:FkbM family methyltransferase
MLFEILRRLLVLSTGHGYDRSARANNLHHKLAYRLHKMLPLFGIRGVQRIEIHAPRGADTTRHLYVRAEDGGVGHQWIMYKQYEPFETSLVKQQLRAGTTVYNIGANVGYYALIASDLVGASGKVIAFEPATSNLELLNRTVSENRLQNVRVMPIAIGDSDGVATLALSETNSGDHQVSLQHHADRDTTEVALRSIDSLIAEGLPQPNAIIMDVQGSEVDVLRGMANCIRDASLSLIFCEFWPGGLNARHTDGAKEFVDRLANAGFAFQLIDEKRRTVKPVSNAELHRARPTHEELNLLCVRGVSRS